MNNKIIICPNEEKLKILGKLGKEKKFQNIKFYTKEEFLKEACFSYDEKCLFYVMKKYHWHIDVVRTYLSYLYVIDEKKNYENPKLIFLKNLKIELEENGYLMKNPIFQKKIEDKTIEVRNYYDLDLYEEDILKSHFEIPKRELTISVHAFHTLEEEINAIAIEIVKLIRKGISPNKIFLGNVREADYYLLEKIFSYYHIPISIPYKDAIYSSKVVLDYLEGKEIDFSKNTDIIKKLYHVLNQLVEIDLEDEVGKRILIDQLKHTYYPVEEMEEAIQIKNIKEESFDDDEYVFVIGFNQDLLPIMKKNVDYLTDSDKKELRMYSVEEWNKREKKLIIYLLSEIKNLYLSYREESPFEKFFPSSFISDFNLKVIKEDIDTYQYSNLYNKLRLGAKFDQFYFYGEKTESFIRLNNSYDIPYRSYDHSFKGINRDIYLEHLDYPLVLSYTSINQYHECSFKYYISHVLKLNLYEDTFASFIGSMYHQILSLYRNPNFHLEEEIRKYLEKRELSLKEKMFFMRIKKDLVALIEVLKRQQLLTGYDNQYSEKRVEVDLDKKVSVKFVGYIDKILFYKNIEDTYFSIIDYKTGTIDTHIEPMKYGLHMQLPVYLYLIHYGRVFKNPIFTGIYYQNILFSYPTWSKKLEKENKEKYYLNGYSIEDPSILARFDSTFEDSTYIKSMKYSEEKGFGTYSKVLSSDMVYHLVTYTKDKINNTVDKILDGDFSINPKVYDGKNISCQFCSFKDLCYMKDSDLEYLDKVEDLSFLGGEE